MTDERYDVIFTGKVMVGTTEEDFKRGLMALYKIKDETRLKKFFTGRPVLVDRNISHRKARRYMSAFEKMGGICRIRRTSDGMTTELHSQVSLVIGETNSGRFGSDFGEGIHMEFRGGMWGLFLFGLISNFLVSTLFLLPIGLHLFLSWLSENIRVSDGRQIRYIRTIGQGYKELLKYIVLMLLLGIAVAAAGFILGPIIGGVLVLVCFAASFYVLFEITKWIVQSFEFKDSGAFVFDGKLPDFIKWMAISPNILMAVLGILSAVLLPLFLSPGLSGGMTPLLVGVAFGVLGLGIVFLYPPWWICKFWGWLVTNVRSSVGWKLGWRASMKDAYKKLLFATLISLLIIPIPWALHRVFTLMINNIGVRKS